MDRVIHTATGAGTGLWGPGPRDPPAADQTPATRPSLPNRRGPTPRANPPTPPRGAPAATAVDTRPAVPRTRLSHRPIGPPRRHWRGQRGRSRGWNLPRLPFVADVLCHAGRPSRTLVQLPGVAMMHEADDVDGTQRMAVRGGSSRPFGPAPDSLPDRRAQRAARMRAARRNTRLISIPGRHGAQLLLATIVLVIAVVAIIAALLRDTGPETTRNVRYPAAPPTEWSTDARWHTPLLLPHSGPALVINTDRVAVVTADRRIMLIEASSGDTVWSGQVPEGEFLTNLAATTIDEQLVVATQVGDRLCWWTLQGGAPGELALPPGARATFLGQAPLIALGPTTVAAVRNGSLLHMELPGGATALAARTTGVTTVASSAGWWHLRPGTPAGPPTPWESTTREPITPIVIAYANDQIITALVGKTVQVLVYSDRDRDVRFNFAGPIRTGESNSGRVSLTWTAAPSREWGILSRTLIDLTRGRIVDLGDWTTQHIAADRALGRIAGRPVLVGPTIPRGQLISGEGFPEDLTTAGALVRASENGSETLYLLPPRIP